MATVHALKSRIGQQYSPVGIEDKQRVGQGIESFMHALRNRCGWVQIVHGPTQVGVIDQEAAETHQHDHHGHGLPSQVEESGLCRRNETDFELPPLGLVGVNGNADLVE